MTDSLPLRLRAFGMDVQSDFAIPGAEPSDHVGDGRALSLTRASLDEVRRGFPDGADRIAELRFDDGRLLVSVDAAGEHGYLAHAFDFGHARVSPDGREVAVAPLASEPPWVWQRYLTGQVLPLAALLQGCELFHACVLGVDGRAIAVVAHSGVGKTTTALWLTLSGLDFMSDDVLVVEPDGDDRVLVHPGIGLANVRPGADSLLEELGQQGIARPIGSRAHETRISIQRSHDAVPLAGLFVLSRFADPRGLELEELRPVEPRILLASTFNVSVQTPERLARQLDVCARVERSASIYRVNVGSDVAEQEVAEAILQHATRLAPC